MVYRLEAQFSTEVPKYKCYLNYGLYRIFYTNILERMTYSHTLLLIPALQPLQDIFTKYISGNMPQNMPFKLYSQQIQEKSSQLKKRTIRGPYRKYSPQQKKEIIQRILQGASLKSIAEQTQIPKRNLIRWKHQFIQNKGSFNKMNSESDDSEEFQESKSQPSQKESIQTKSIISESSLKVEKIEL